jgi:hypothetical protein
MEAVLSGSSSKVERRRSTPETAGSDPAFRSKHKLTVSLWLTVFILPANQQKL